MSYDAHVPQENGGVYDGTFTDYRKGYSHLLPYVTLTQELPDDYHLRAAFSKTLGRPAFSDIAQAQVIATGATGGDNTLTRGNPNLRPRVSSNFDISADHFFNGHDGLVSIAGFYKYIKDDIYTLTTPGGAVIDGVTYDVSQPENASHSLLKGVEVQFIDNHLSFLPGTLGRHLGFSANGTRMWAKLYAINAGVQIERNNMLYQPNWLANANLFWSLPEGGEIRVAYNWMDQSLNTINASPAQDYVLEAHGTLNASVRYPIRRNLMVKLEADNITGENLSMMHGYYSERYTIQVNRTFLLDLIWTR